MHGQQNIKFLENS